MMIESAEAMRGRPIVRSSPGGDFCLIDPSINRKKSPPGERAAARRTVTSAAAYGGCSHAGRVGIHIFRLVRYFCAAASDSLDSGSAPRKIRLALIYGRADRVALRGSKRNRGSRPPAA